MEYVGCNTCGVSVIKQLFRKHTLDHGVSACKCCEKQFSYEKRLKVHIEKSVMCAEFYRTNQLDIPELKQEKRRKKVDLMNKVALLLCLLMTLRILVTVKRMVVSIMYLATKKQNLQKSLVVIDLQMG